MVEVVVSGKRKSYYMMDHITTNQVDLWIGFLTNNWN
jgi:hypothetical protein